LSNHKSPTKKIEIEHYRNYFQHKKYFTDNSLALMKDETVVDAPQESVYHQVFKRSFPLVFILFKYTHFSLYKISFIGVDM
jgi:hypothetical protein